MGLLLEAWPPLPAILATNGYHRVEKHKLVPKRMAGLVKMLHVVNVSVSILTFISSYIINQLCSQNFDQGMLNYRYRQ